MQKIITKDLQKELIANYELSQQGFNRLDMVPVVRLFTPDSNATWVIVSGEECDRDLIMFGWCDLGLGSPEFGCVSRNELQAVRGSLGLPVERDAYFQTDLRLEDYVEDSRWNSETQFFG